MQRYYSGIYWHFTGSPDGIQWHLVRRPKHILQQGRPKPPDKAVRILKDILASRKLLATCKETVAGYLETEKFCCTCDIPLKDLPGHRPYYGDAAIGFRAEAIYDACFNPVLYTNAANLIGVLGDLEADEDYALDENTTFHEDDSLETLLLHLFGRVSLKLGPLVPYLKITEFDTDEAETLYREREWRHLGDFEFLPDDVAAVLVPEAYISDLRKHLHEHGYGDCTLVLSWEFLEQA